MEFAICLDLWGLMTMPYEMTYSTYVPIYLIKSQIMNSGSGQLTGLLQVKVAIHASRSET